MSRARPVARLIGGMLVLAFLVWRFGTGPFADAWRVTTWQSVVGALLLTVAATLANAWRWRVIAQALGAPLTARGSVAAYCRSQFLNATLPGGFLGDAHRGLSHGRTVGDLGVGLRSTLWDRVAGQVVQVGLLVVALVALPTPLRPYASLALGGLASFCALGWWLSHRRGSTAFVGRDLHAVLRGPVAVPVLLASLFSSVAHVGVFLLAVEATSIHASAATLVAVALVVLVGSALPLNVAGWGPREGVTAAAFAVVGLGAAAGLTVSVVFGVLSTVATLPGAVVLTVDAVRSRSAVAARPDRALEEAHRG